MCSVLWLLPPSFKNDAILLSLSNCVLPVFSLCHPLIFLPFLNNCIPLSVRLYPTNTPSILPPSSLSLQKPKRNWVQLEHLCTWKKNWPNTGFPQEEDRNRPLNECKRLEWYFFKWGGGGIFAMKWCVLSGLSAEQHQREEMEEEKFGEDRKVWWWWGGGKKDRSKIASPCKNVYLTVVHCFAPCVVFPHLCVILCWCDILFYVLCVFVLCAALLFLTFLFWVAFVCTTPGSNSLHKHYLQLVLSHTGAAEL